MLKPRLFHHFKAGALLSVTLVVAVAVTGLVWLNERGFEGKWGERIEEELARRGIHADFASVRFSPTRGIVAREVVLYTDSSRRPGTVFARMPVLRFDIDRGKALRGDLQISRIIIRDADFALPLNAENDLALQIRNLSGWANLDREDRLVLEDAHGTLGGLKFKLQVELEDFVLPDLREGDESEEESAKRQEFSEDLATELARWSFPESQPPELTLRVTGSVKRPATIRTSFSVKAADLTRRDYTMHDLDLTGELHGRTLTVDHLAFSDGAGQLRVHADYDLEDQTGSYDVSSTIKIADFLRNALNNSTLNEFASAHAPRLDARGRFTIPAEGPLELSSIGKVEMRFFRFLGIPIDRLETEFSWQNGDIFLRDLEVVHEAGKLTGQILMRGDTIRYRATSSLPFSAFQAFIREDSGIERSLERSVFTGKSKVHAEAEGTIRRSNLREWDARGIARLENFSYQGVPLALASARFNITPLDYIFTEVETEFLYASYPAFLQHGGPRSGLIQAEKIHYDAEAGLTHLERVRGTAWPAPVLRLFTSRHDEVLDILKSKAADHVQNSYRFRSPPELDSSGVIDMRKPAARTDVTTQVRARGLTDYDFLGQTLELSSLSANVRTRPRLNNITDLHFGALGGSGAGDLQIKELPERATEVTGKLSLDKLDVAQIGKTYKLAGFREGELSTVAAFDALGTTREDGKRTWNVEGNTAVGRSNFNTVPLVRAKADFRFHPTGQTWTDAELEFDYANYAPRRKHGGPRSALVRIDKVYHDKEKKLTSLSNVRGTAWPGPLLRLVRPTSADHVEENYRFRSPPEFTTAGVIDHQLPPRRTNLTSEFETSGIIDYDFLDQTIQLSHVRGTLRNRHLRHDVSDLRFRTLRGSGAGTITVEERPGKPSSIAAGIKWDDLSLADLGRKYKFDNDAKGTITGRIDFTTEARNVRALNGRGVVGLRNGQLFLVPVFGPLSIPIGGILGKKFSHEQARDASATFVIKNGAVHTNDFLTSTPSTVFTGEGKVDLPTKHLDMTVRMNARGLLGLVILPLRPFNGLFQFRGRGPIKKPTWSASPFTQPKRGPDDPIFRAPARAEIVPER